MALSMAEMLKLRGENPSRKMLRKIVQEDLPLFKMLATNGKFKPQPK